MSKNSLYNVISQITIKENHIPGVTHLSLRTHSQGKKYYFFELPVQEKTMIGPYSLSRHHLSVYEGATSKLDLKSQYHYTAYFHDRAETMYRLHVYFNDHDDYVCEPLLSVLTKDNTFEPVNSQQHYEAAKTLTQFSINGLVKHLRNTQYKTVEALQGQLDALEREASELSKDLVKNKTAYLAITEKQIALLEELKGYSNQHRDIFSKSSFLQGMKKAVAEKVEDKKETKQDQNAAEAVSLKSSTDIKVEKKKTRQSKSNVHKPGYVKTKDGFVKKKTGLDKELEGLKAKLVQAKALKEKGLGEIEALWLSILGKEVEIENGIYDAQLKERNDLRVLKKELDAQGLSLLNQLLLKGDFVKAEKLSPFYPLLTAKLMDFALLTENTKLMEFLLKNKIVRVSYSQFSINNVQYNSLTDYFFKKKNHSSTTVDALDILVKNGLSLMSIDSDSGLPFAAVLLLNPKHPLRTVLERNAQLTLQNPMFYKQLNQVLHVLVSLSNCSKEKTLKIAQLMVVNNNAITRLKAVKHSSQGKILNKLGADLVAHVTKTLGADLLDQIQADPAFQKLSNILKERQKAVLAKMPRHSHAAFLRGMKKGSDVLKKALDAIVDLDAVPSFEEAKKSAIEKHFETLNYYNLVEELMDVQNQLKRSVHHRGKANRAQKQLILRQKELVEELSARDQERMESLQGLIDLDQSVKAVNTLATLQENLLKYRDLMSNLLQLIEGDNSFLSEFQKDSEEDSKEDPIQVGRELVNTLFSHVGSEQSDSSKDKVSSKGSTLGPG